MIESAAAGTETDRGQERGRGPRHPDTFKHALVDLSMETIPMLKYR